MNHPPAAFFAAMVLFCWLMLVPASAPAGEIYGQLLSSKNSKPVAGIMVEAYYLNGEHQSVGPTDAQGKYHLKGLPAKTDITIRYLGNPGFWEWGFAYLCCPDEGARVETNAMLYPKSEAQPYDSSLKELERMKVLLKAVRPDEADVSSRSQPETGQADPKTRKSGGNGAKIRPSPEQN